MSRSSGTSGLLLLISSLALGASRSAAGPLGLAWGLVAEPATAGAITPGALAEQLEFLRAHSWRPIRATGVGGPDSEPTVLLGFDDPASALRYAVPLLELYDWPALVSVDAAQAADPALRPVLAKLAMSPWIDLVPRVEPEIGHGGAPAVGCQVEGVTDPAHREEETLLRLRQSLAGTVARLREMAAEPAAVVWAPDAWSGSAERAAADLGLTLSLPTFTGMPPTLSGRRIARFAVPARSGISDLVQASVGWDPRDHPVRFVEVDAAWVCAAGDSAARVERLLDAVRGLGANGVRLRPGGADGAWFATTAATVRGDVVGPLARTLRAAGVRWLLVDLPETSGDAQRDRTLVSDLARAVDADVAVLPEGATAAQALGEAVLSQRPATRLAWRGEGPGRPFYFGALGPGRQNAERGATLSTTTAAAANADATARAIAGWSWLGLPVELAEAGLATSPRTLAAFVLAR